MSETDFFDSFPDFQHNPKASISSEFRRLAKLRRWKQGSKNWKKNWNRCVNTEYDRLLGKNVVGLDDWIDLCEELGLGDEFGSIRQCKMVCIHFTYVPTYLYDETGCWLMELCLMGYGRRVEKLGRYAFMLTRYLEYYTGPLENPRQYSRHPGLPNHWIESEEIPQCQGFGCVYASNGEVF